MTLEFSFCRADLKENQGKSKLLRLLQTTIYYEEIEKSRKLCNKGTPVP